MNQSQNNKLMQWLAESKGYIQLPPRLAAAYGDGKALVTEDAFGANDRLQAILQVLEGRNLGNMIDLGGHSGFFSLSLVDAGLARTSVVCDLDEKALEAGRLMAAELGIDQEVRFVKQGIDIEFMRSMQAYDTILNLNLIHHAGSLFDVDEVRKVGWEQYAQTTLECMRKKCKTALFGIGIKRNKPVHLSTSRDQLASTIEGIAAKAGWAVRYSANVQDIAALGAERANGAYKHKGIADKLRHWLPRKLRGGPEGSKRDLYHLYILE